MRETQLGGAFGKFKLGSPSDLLRKKANMSYPDQSDRSVPSVPNQAGLHALRKYALASQVPYQFVNRPLNRQRDGTGQFLIPGAVAQNVPAVVAHDLARVPVRIELIDNAALAPTRLQVTARSSTSVTIVPLDAALDPTAIIRIV